MRPLSLVLLVASTSLAFCSSQVGISPAPTAKRVFGVVFRPSEHDASVKRALDSYLGLVKSTYGWDYVYIEAGSRTSPNAIRNLIKKAWIEDKIEGVFLVGSQPMIKFGAALGKDLCPCPEYYTDIDGRFEDTDRNGVLDLYIPWESGDVTPQELWLARVMPDTVTREGLLPDMQLTSYFSKLSNWIRSAPAPHGSTVILSSKDWPGRVLEAREMRSTFGSTPKAFSAIIEQSTGTVSAPQQSRSTPELLFKALQTRSDFTYISVHGGGVDWVCDAPFRDSNVVATRAGGRFFAADTFRVNASVLASMSCHYLNLEGEKSTLAASVVLHPQNRCFLTFGSSRGIGLEELPWFIKQLRSEPPTVAWKSYLNRLGSESFLKQWLGVRNAWEKEKSAFVWGYYWYGAPFGPFEVGLGKGATQ